ncbi:MAG: DEAD/DEAH box helicase [Myxococcota bacterium]
MPGPETPPFSEATRAWFAGAFERPTEVQIRGWPRIVSGEHVLLIAPTGSGKTLAAFLACLDRLAQRPEEATPGVRVLYVSPLKALAYDVDKNLRAPLAGITRTAGRLGTPVHLPRVAVRTGDTPQKERQRHLKQPPEILVTTPESLYLLLGSRARETLRTVETVIIDEAHALAPTKRGAHLGLSLERLAALAEHDPQRIGLSATARPARAVASWLGGERPVAVEDTSATPALDLRIEVPVRDMTRPELDGPLEDVEPEGEPPRGPTPPPPGLWPAIHPRLVELIRAHRSTLVFVNSRGLCERLCQRLNEAAGTPDDAPLVRAHHGSLSQERRREVEQGLKVGTLRGIVATSSLELGIDMGAVDLVVMVESPGAVGRGLQRVGRAGHSVGEVSLGRIFPKHRGDLLESAVVARRMMEGAIESLHVPVHALDVLAQQVVAMVSVEPWTVGALEAVVQRCAGYRELSRDALVAVLDMLSGHYPSNELADLRPRIRWNRTTNVLEGRQGAKTLSLVNGGTIPDRGLYPVRLGADGPRVGELDEEMVHETTPGQTLTLGASTWRVEEITHDRVIVRPAPGEPGKLPFWHGEGPGRPLELGRAVGTFVRELATKDPTEAEAWLVGKHALEPLAARNLIAYVREQREATGTLPTDRAITVERFRDELGDWRVCILTPFGSRVHAPWAFALQAALGQRTGFEVRAMWGDDGISLTLADREGLPPVDELVPDPEGLEERVLEQLGQSAVFASQFRENAARALLLPRRRPGARTPLWQQRLKAQRLLAVARQYPSFPVVMETYRSCLRDVFDLPALVDVLRRVRRREVRVDAVETATPSPFAKSLVFEYVAAHMYEGDSPLAERRAQALALDRDLLRELLGQDGLRELLDAGVVAAVEAELQGLDPEWHARHADALHDLLRRVGDLTEAEVADRSDGAARSWLTELERGHRAIPVRMADESRWIAIEDAALYRDGLGAFLPHGVPNAFLEPHSDALAALLARWARTHGPFRTRDVAARFGLATDEAERQLRHLEQDGKLLEGAFHPEGGSREWCDPEVLRRIKRRTLATLRGQVAPVDAPTVARFLQGWHGLDTRRRLEDGIVQLEGLPVPHAELEGMVLPLRGEGFSAARLDELGATGWLVWVGHGALGQTDGRVALYRRDRVAHLLEPPEVPEGLGEPHRRILDHLDRRGACFFAELEATCGRADRTAVLDALWDLVWAGLITNDTFHALRSLRNSRRAPIRRRRDADRLAAGGRWSLVSELLIGAPSATERAHARAVATLDRHGVVTREVGAIEALPGGFGPLYRVLRAMEEAGKVRRGYFVEGLGGAQFAQAGVIDRLRGARHPSREPDVRVLSAVDPAQPYGWLVPWPPLAGGPAPGAQRAAGAAVVLDDGHPVLYVARGGKRLRTFEGRDEPERLARAARALTPLARTRRGHMLRIEEIDGEPARTSRHAAALRDAAFGMDHRGLVLELR